MRLNTLLHTAVALLAAQPATAIDLNVDDPSSIKAASKVVVDRMLEWYDPSPTPGLLPQSPDKYYWWEAGAMFGSLVDYWRYTGDTSYVNLTTNALLAQVGPDKNYMPPEQASQLGNDDQGFWGFSAMAAAEYNFPNPPANKPQWLALAQAVFNSQAARWNNATCGGGLRWQIFLANTGYNYKNTISNGAFFNLGARLYAYTGNGTFLNWAETSFEWSQSIGLISKDWLFYDGTDTLINCSGVDHTQWSYNPAVHLHGAAVLYNATGSDVWKQRAQSIWTAMSIFFQNNIMYEMTCEPSQKCNLDQKSFKAYVGRWLAASLKVAPFLEPQMKPFIRASATAAAKQCTGGTDGTTCGIDWLKGVYDGTSGVGQQLSALEWIQANLIDSVGPPVTNSTGGTSKGDNNAGSKGDQNPLLSHRPITTADRAGAAIITILFVIGSLSGAWFMMT